MKNLSFLCAKLYDCHMDLLLQTITGYYMNFYMNLLLIDVRYFGRT